MTGMTGRTHECRVCSRRFARAEHLTRHRRTHTREKPYSCHFCSATFQREDVRTRHSKICPEAPADAPPILGRKRVQVACEPCRRRKTGCNGQEPCDQCRRAEERNCHYDLATFQPAESSFGGIEQEDSTPVALGPSTPALASLTSHALPHNATDWVPDLPADGFELPTDSFEPFWFNQTDLELPYLVFDDFSYLGLEQPHDSALEHPLVKVWQSDFESNAVQGVTPSARMWYSGRPNLGVYPPEILRVFLGLFRKHVPSTFAVFAQPEQHFAPYYTLAAAALGGLFSSVSGSRLVSNALHNDARRLCIEQFGKFSSTEDAPDDIDQCIVSIKAYILIQLYGTCSGDQRSYEFAEIYHAHLIRMVNDYCMAVVTNGKVPTYDKLSALLAEALLILDGYRFLIMQLPPVSAVRSMALVAEPGSRTAAVLQQVSHVAKRRAVGEGSVSRLSLISSLATHVWSVRFPPQHDTCDDKTVQTRTFIELACESWWQQHDSADFPSAIIHHMLLLSLHTNVSVLQKFAYSSHAQASGEISNWIRTRHYEIASWHADRILTTVEDALCPMHESDLRSGLPVHIEPERLPFEVPHIPYLVYYSALVLWAHLALQQNLASNVVRAPILRAERILRLQKLHIARLLAGVLGELKERK